MLKLYRTLRKTERTHPNQLVFYDPGVGTLERPDPFHRFKQNFNLVIGLAFGYGLDDNVLASYQFIVENHREGDDIYLFGFSRGAYTVRVLAALIHKIGLISLPQNNLAGSGLTAYKQFSTDHVAPDQKDDPAAQYARILSVKWPTIKFVGVWDTVASVIVPRWDRINPAKLQFSPWSLEELAFIRENPSIEIFRQAISIDERRRMFRPQPWDAGKFRPHRYAPESSWTDQDSVQVWFAGVHSDVGGGYPEKESALSKYPLLWMIEEAVKHGLKVDRRTVNQLGWGRKRKNSPFDYVAPDFLPYPDDPGFRRLAAARFDERRLARARGDPEEGQVQGMAGAEIDVRLLHSVLRAAADSRGRVDPPVRARQDRAGQDLQAGEHPDAVHGGAAGDPAPAGMADDAGEDDGASS